MSDYWNKKMDELNKSNAKSSAKSSETKGYWNQKMAELEEAEKKKKKKQKDIAPVRTEVTKKEEEDDKGLDFFQKGAFEDGYQRGDVTKAILGTVGDLGVGVIKGAAKTVGGVIDAGTYGVAGIADLVGEDDFADRLRVKARENVIDKSFAHADSYLDQYSLLGKTSDAIAEGLGQVGAVILTGGAAGALGAGALGATAATTGLMGVSSFGAGVGEAYEAGATDEEAATYGLIKGVVDAGSEMIFGGLGKTVKALGLSHGLTSLDDVFAQKLSSRITSNVAKNFVEFGVKASAEGVEEVLAGIGSAVGKQMTYMEEKELRELIADENLLEQFVVGAVTSGISQSGLVPGMKRGSLREANKKGRDFISGMSQNEQKVIDKEFENRVSEQEKDGDKLTQKEKDKIYDAVVSDMEKGYISTDTIEEVLGGDTFKSYRETVDSEDALAKEFEELGKKQNATLAEQSRYNELKQQMDEIKQNSQRNTLKSQLSEEVMGLVQNDRLSESYNERARRGQAYEADLTKYDQKQQAVIQKAVDSGILNNTRRTHEFVDMIAKISADKGVLFDFTNNEKLKGTSFAVDGKTVNGFVTKDGVTLNIDSAKSLNSVVGHEITHVLEGTELYTELQKAVMQYAKTKKDYRSRVESIKELYKNVTDADTSAELTADLVGDYLFTDPDFINHLSVNHRNVFQKIYDEIKYLAKVATAGSKEARELEKVKRAFEKAYKEGGKVKEDTKYSIGEIVGEGQKSYGIGVHLDSTLLENLNPKERLEMVKERIKELGGEVFTAYDNSGNAVDITIAKPQERYKNQSGKKKAVNNDLTTKYIGNETKQEAVVLVDELITTAKYLDSEAPRYSHDWLDNNGQNDWDYWTTYIQDKNNTIWEATLNVANTADGRKIIYDISPIKKVGQSVKSDTSLLNENVTQDSDNVKYSVSDSDGKKLTKEQSEYFKDSKMRDENGNLKVMYHGSQDAGFHVFDASKSDDDTSFFFVDRNDVAATYSGTSETYEAKTIRTAEDMNRFLAEIGYDQYEAVEKNGKFELLENGDHVAYSDTAQGIYEEFCWYEGVGEGDANYKVYLNLKNPLVVDAKGRNWNNISREFSQEIADRYHSLTAEEKDALTELADWGEYSIFRDELLAVAKNRETSVLASAVEKLGGANANLFDAFSIASDNFSDESISQFAMKQMKTRDYAAKAKAEGYDGVIFKNIHDNGGYSNGSEGASTVAIAFESNQIKSVANEKPTADKDIRYSLSDPETERYIAKSTKKYGNVEKAAIEHFGTTDNFRTAGYILRDGQMLDFSGAHWLDGESDSYIADWKKKNDIRQVDHEDVFEAFEISADDFPNDSRKEFINRGNIRMSPEAPGINIAAEPTAEQYQVIRNLIKSNPYNAQGFYVDIENKSKRIDKIVYSGKVNADRVINDIKYFYQNGEVREQSSISQFLSISGKDRRAYGAYNVYGKDIALETAPVQEVAPVEETVDEMPIDSEEGKQDFPHINKYLNSTDAMFPDDLAPMQSEIDRLEAEKAELENRMTPDDAELEEQWWNIEDRINALEKELAAEESARMDSLSEDDAPPEMDAPYSEEVPFEDGQSVAVEDPFENREVPHGNEGKKVNAYMYDNPEVRPFFQAEAYALMEELNNGTKGERWYNDHLWYETGGEQGFGGTKRHQSESIDRLSYEFNLSYEDIEKGLSAIIEDHGAENIAAAKKIEFVINDRLMYGYKPFGAMLDPDAGKPNQDYIALMQDKQRVDSLTDADAPPISEEIAPSFEETVSGQQKIPDKRGTPIAGTDGVVPTFDAQPRKGVADGQQAMFEEPPIPEKITRASLHEGILDNIKSAFKDAGFDLDEVLRKAKNLSTFSTVDNIPQRVMEKALGYKEGQVLSDLTVNQAAQNETEGIKWLNSFTDRKNGVLAQISKQYNIKPGSKESAAAQMYAEGFYVGENNDIIAYGDAELAKDFPDAEVQANIKALAKDGRIRQIYDETLAAINESRTRNAYPAIPRLDNYFLHFRAMEDTFSRLGLPFNPNDIRAKDLPTDLNGVTADLKPGQPYFASAMHRTGQRTSFDLLGGLERYLSSAKNQIYHIDDIQTLRALRNYIADTYGQAHGLENLDTLSEEEAQERIKEVYGAHLSTFAKFLNEEANVLAGKTALIDRGLEGIIGRRGMTFLDTLNRQVGSNMVGFNVSSSLTNFLPVVQTFAKGNKAAFVKAFAQTVAHKVSGRSDGFAENSPVMIRRKGADRFYRTMWQKAGDAGYSLMGVVDSVSTELIARTKYNELVSNGMDSQKAHFETDKWVSRMMGDRSLGQQPQLYNSKMLGLLTKFQLEVRNQLDSQFYDTIQEAKVSNEHIQNEQERNAKTAAKVASTFLQLAVAQHLFGQAFESVAGYNPAFDIIEVLMTAFGFDDDEESEDTVGDNIEQALLALAEDLPYASTFLDGGRIPISSALPIAELVKGEDEWGNEKSRWETLGEIAPYYAMPTGYGQLKKTVKGLSMFSDDHPIAGSYTDSGNLRFPVEDTLGNRAKAAVFGQYANENARNYFDNERSALKEKQIQEFIDVGMDIEDYWAYRDGLKKQETLEDKFDYIAGLDLSVEQKNVLINNIVDRKEDVDMANYDDFASYEEFDFYSKNTAKYNFLQDHGVSYAEYMSSEDAKERYDSDYSWYKNNPEKVYVSKAVTDNVLEYRQYARALDDIRADKDANGKSINGSAKQKKADYINSLDIDYGAKLILFKSEYKADDTYNMEIVEYLNNRQDITHNEMVTILQELGFTVNGNTVSW